MINTPRPTMADVAAAAGVSRALVSIVIRGAAGASDTTRAHVLEVARQLGYRPDTRARLLRSSRTKLIGVVFNVTEPYPAELVELLYDAADAQGYAITLSATGARRSEQTALESLLDLGVEAIIVIAPATNAGTLANMPVPVIAMLNSPDGSAARTVGSVQTDEAAGIHLALDHLHKLGHRRIAYIDGGTAIGSAVRREAYQAAMAGSGSQPLVIHGGPLESDGSRAGTELLAITGLPDVSEGSAHESPTAVVIFNDRCALGALDTFRGAGVRIPEELSVVGYDNSRMARLEHINLTSVSQDGPALAAAAISAAVERISGGAIEHQVLAPWLEVGGTTAAPTPE